MATSQNFVALFNFHGRTPRDKNGDYEIVPRMAEIKLLNGKTLVGEASSPAFEGFVKIVVISVPDEVYYIPDNAIASVSFL